MEVHDRLCRSHGWLWLWPAFSHRFECRWILWLSPQSARQTSSASFCGSGRIRVTSSKLTYKPL